MKVPRNGEGRPLAETAPEATKSESPSATEHTASMRAGQATYPQATAIEVASGQCPCDQWLISGEPVTPPELALRPNENQEPVSPGQALGDLRAEWYRARSNPFYGRSDVREIEALGRAAAIIEEVLR